MLEDLRERTPCACNRIIRTYPLNHLYHPLFDRAESNTVGRLYCCYFLVRTLHCLRDLVIGDTNASIREKYSFSMSCSNIIVHRYIVESPRPAQGLTHAWQLGISSFARVTRNSTVDHYNHVNPLTER
jgi:hypothetical protein